MRHRLAGRVAIITGGAGGIGQAIAQRLAEEGADIAVADIGDMSATEDLVRKAGRRFVGVVCDVSDPQAADALRVQVGCDLGAVDIVVNNAAFMSKCPFEELDFATWRKSFAVNVDGCYLVTKAFVEDLKRSSSGRVISMSSTSVWLNAPEFVQYVSTKAAIIGFTSALATELGKYGVTANSVAPSLIRTPGALRQEGDETFAMLASMQVIKREQTTDDLTGLVAFLASDEAAFITGQTHVVDGGLTRH